MIKTKKALVFALAFPIMVLAMLIAYREYVLSCGEEVILPITGYDPRDLLSGHYLIYRIEYGVGEVCPFNNLNKQTGYICLEPKMFSYSHPEKCKKLIRGICNYDRFSAGIERYYIAESKAPNLDRAIRSKHAKVVLSITRSGTAQVKDLIIDGGRD